MTIGSPSGSGATQTDIASGTAEHVANYRQIVNTALTVSKPDNVTVSGSGATPQFSATGVVSRSSTSGDDGQLGAGGNRIISPSNESGVLLAKIRYASDISISNLGDTHDLGWAGPFFDWAVFRPHIGNDTSGNVAVRNDGNVTSSQVSYPSITTAHNYCVIMDYDGIFINANTTGFYIDSDPRAGDNPNATISQVPRPDNNIQGGFYYQSAGNDNRLFANHLEVTQLESQ